VITFDEVWLANATPAELDERWKAETIKAEIDLAMKAIELRTRASRARSKRPGRK
jgi:hypothetical protein